MTEQRADSAEESIGELFGQLVDDTKTFVKAEIRVYRAGALHRLAGYRKYIAFAAIGALLAFCAVILLLIAAVFALAPFISVAGAALLIAVLSIAVAALLFSIVTEKVRKELKQLGGEE